MTDSLKELVKKKRTEAKARLIAAYNSWRGRIKDINKIILAEDKLWPAIQEQEWSKAYQLIRKETDIGLVIIRNELIYLINSPAYELQSPPDL